MTYTYALIQTAQDLPNPLIYESRLMSDDSCIWQVQYGKTCHWVPDHSTGCSWRRVKIEDHFPIHDPRFNPDDLKPWVREVFDRMFEEQMNEQPNSQNS